MGIRVVILLGPPGAGKGTVADGLKGSTPHVHVSTGDMLRAAVKAGTPVGAEAEAYMQRGALVPDILMMRVVEERLDGDGADAAYLFDGFPRTEVQAELLDRALTDRGGRIERVVFLNTPIEVLTLRLSGRRVCRACGATFHLLNIPPKKEGVCDACGGELYQRPDDKEETILNRLDVYDRQTESLIARYERQGLLVRVRGDQPPDELIAEIAGLM